MNLVLKSNSRELGFNYRIIKHYKRIAIIILKSQNLGRNGQNYLGIMSK